jgi:hypothetical protein
MRKIWLFNAQISKKYSLSLLGGILLPLFLFAGSCNATQDWPTFNDYSTGVLNGQNSWSGATGYGVQSEAGYYQTGKGVKITTTGAEKTISNTDFTQPTAATGTFSFYVKSSAWANLTEVFFYQEDALDNGNTLFLIADYLEGTGIYIGTDDTWDKLSSYSLGEWAKISINWDTDNHNNYNRYKVNDGDWTDWLPVWGSYNFNTAGTLLFSTRGSGISAFDDFILEEEETPPPEYPELNPNWADVWLNATGTPPAGFSQETEEEFANQEISGTLNRRLCTASPCTNGDAAHYYELDVVIKAVDFAGFYNSKTIKIPIDWDYDEETYDFSTTTILSTSTENYKISYLLSGYNSERGEEVLISFDDWSFISLNETIFGTPQPPELPDIPDLAVCPDCATTTGIEKFTCNTQKILCEIFWPTPSKVKEVVDTNNKIKDKAPFNYLNEFNGFISDMRADITSTEEIVFTAWGGSTSTINFDWLEATSTLAGQTFSLADTSKGFFQLVIIFGLVFWAIGYIKRIIK